jgi:hypothetical protein
MSILLLESRKTQRFQTRNSELVGRLSIALQRRFRHIVAARYYGTVFWDTACPCWAFPP